MGLMGVLIMATAAVIAENVVNDTGHVELVVDAAGGNFSDNGIYRHMNAANRFLHDLLPYHGEVERTQVELAVGQYVFQVPGIRHVKGIDLVESNGDVARLEPVSWDWMNSNYQQQFAQVDNAKPRYWTRGRTYKNVAAAEQLLDPTLDTQVDEGYGQLGVVGVVNITSFPPPLDDWVWTNNDFLTFNQSSGSNNLIIIKLDTSEATSFTFIYQGTAPLQLFDNGTPTTQFLPGVEYTIDVSELGASPYEEGALYLGPGAGIQAGDTITNISVKTVTGVPFAMSTLSVPWFVNMPPSDEVRTLEVHGGHYADEVTEGTDETWWSANHPDILEEATKLDIEGKLHRNDTGENQKLHGILLRVKQIYHNQCEEEQAGPIQSTRKGYGYKEE